jgi:hypothetical protein
MGVREHEIRTLMTSFYKESVTTFQLIIEKGVASGKFKAENSDKTARAVYLLFMGVFFTYFSIDVDFDIAEQNTFQLNNIIEHIKKN